MTAINFPDSPSNGDTHVVGDVTYTYNAAETKWKTTISSNNYLPLTGGTVSGNLVLGGELQHSGDTDTKLHFDTDTIKLDTTGSERFRVGSAGQLGIGGATYGTSGQVLTSGGPSAAPSWGDVSTGNDFNFAEGNLSGSSELVTGLPADAVKIVIPIRNVHWSSNSTSFMLRLGNGSVLTSGYTSISGFHGGGQGAASFTDKFMLNQGFGGTNVREYGTITLNKMSSTIWSMTFQGLTTSDPGYILHANGQLSHSGTIDRFELSVNTGTFSGGSYGVNVYSE